MVTTTRFVTLLFVNVDVEDIDGITTPSIAMTHAELRERVVSEALPSSMLHAVNALAVQYKALIRAVVSSPVFVHVTDPFNVHDVIVAPLIVVAVATQSTGVTRVGEVERTLLPLHVDVVTPVPPLATGRMPLTCVGKSSVLSTIYY